MNTRLLSMLVIAGGGLSASAATMNGSLPLSIPVSNPCVPSDTVTLSGSLHYVAQTDTNASGTTVKLHVNLQNFGGSTASGRGYRAQLNGKATLEFASTVLPASASGSVNVRLVSQGPSDNFRLKVNFDVSVDGNNVTITNPTAVPEGTCGG